jgi:hypothetical protein
MYSDLYKGENHVQISAVQLITAALIVVFTFVIPASYLQYRQTNPASTATPYTAEALNQRPGGNVDVADEGRVAGASTDGQSNNGIFRLPLTNYYFDMNSQSGLLTIGGGSLIFLGLSLLFYVIISDKPQKRPEFSFEVESKQFELDNLEQWK